MNKKELLMNAKDIALVGVTQNQEKYGYKIYKRLKDIGKNVFPVSPIYKEIDKDCVYPTLEDIENKLDLIVFVVNSKLAKEYVEKCKLDTIFWFQPNTYDNELLAKLDEKGHKYVCGCVLVESEEDEI